MPNLIVLLSEAFVAIYMSLLSYALATCDAHILYRLVGQNVANSLWSAVFGGMICSILLYKFFKFTVKNIFAPRNFFYMVNLPVCLTILINLRLIPL